MKNVDENPVKALRDIKQINWGKVDTPGYE
jgi:hypothetical protein